MPEDMRPILETERPNELLTDEGISPRPRAGRPVTRSNPREGSVPGATLSPERSDRLRQALHGINVAEMAVRGSDVIVYPNP